MQMFPPVQSASTLHAGVVEVRQVPSMHTALPVQSALDEHEPGVRVGGISVGATQIRGAVPDAGAQTVPRGQSVSLVHVVAQPALVQTWPA